MKLNRKYALALLKKENFEAELERLIEACTVAYSGRAKLLRFIKEEIVFFKSLLDRKTPFETEEFEEYQKKITMLFNDFIELSKRDKNDPYSVHVNRLNKAPLETKELKGIINIGLGFFHPALCKSGECIEEEFMKRYDLNFESTIEEVKKQVEKICKEYSKIQELQNALDLEVKAHDVTRQESAAKDQEIKFLTEQLKLSQAQASQTVTTEAQTTMRRPGLSQNNLISGISIPGTGAAHLFFRTAPLVPPSTSQPSSSRLRLNLSSDD